MCIKGSIEEGGTAFTAVGGVNIILKVNLSLVGGTTEPAR